MSPRAERTVDGCPRCALRAGRVAGVVAAGALTVGLFLAGTPGALATTPSPTPVPATSTAALGESWAAELAIDGGDDSGLVLSDGGVRLAAPSAPGRPAEGVLTLAPRRLASPTPGLAGVVTADLPAGTGIDVQARGLDRRGVWGDWLPVRGGSPARFATPTVDVQVRVFLHGAPTGTATPVLREVWLTALATPTPPVRPTTKPTTTTTPTTTRPTTTRPTPPPRPTSHEAGATDEARSPGEADSAHPARPADQAGSAPAADDDHHHHQAPADHDDDAARTRTRRRAAGAPGGRDGRADRRAAALWNGAIATTGLKGFKDTPYNITGDSSVKVVDGPPKAIRFTVPSGSQRAEIEPDVPEFREGQTRFFRLTYTLPPSFPTQPEGFQLATQWKNDGEGSPPLELRVEKGQFVLGGGYGRPGGSRLFSQDVAPVVTGKPVELVVGITFSSDSAKSRVDVWVDGQQRVSGFRPPGGTLYPGLSSYWKVGLYRDTSNSRTASADLTAAAMGTSYDAVR